MVAPFAANGWVTLTTDFGDADGYVGAMKGVIYSAFRSATVIDIAHHVPPQSIVHGAHTVATACRHFPVGTVHVVVVDPGVGSARAPMAVVAGGHCFIGPDNGVLMMAAAALADTVDAYRIERSFGHPSATFHGRDIFAPAAAHVAAGALQPRELGPPMVATTAPPSAPVVAAHGVTARVVRVDHFGNAITNLKADQQRRAARVKVGNDVELSVLTTYSDVARGHALALFGSEGWLEVAVRDGSAAQKMGLSPGDAIDVLFEDP